MQSFFDNSDQDVGGHGNPDLGFDGIFARAQKCLDTQMLLDPFEEQFDLPTLFVQSGNQFWLERKIVGQECDAFARVVSDDHAPQGTGVVSAGIKNGEYPSLVADDLGRRPIDWLRVATFEFGIALGSCDEKCAGLVNGVQPSEIEIAAIHQVERTRLDDKVVQDVDFVRLAVGYVNETRNCAAQVEQCVQLDSSLGGSKRRLGINRQTQVDRRCVERIDCCVQIDAQRFAGIQRARNSNEVLREVGIDLPGPSRVRIGQRIARNRLTAESHVIEPRRLRSQVDFDVAQRLAVSKLRKRHGEKLIQTREVLDLVLAPVRGDTAPERGQRQVCHDLRKNELALMHRDLLRKFAKNPNSALRRSNRDQNKTSIYSSESLTYKPSM